MTVINKALHGIPDRVIKYRIYWNRIPWFCFLNLFQTGPLLETDFRKAGLLFPWLRNGTLNDLNSSFSYRIHITMPQIHWKNWEFRRSWNKWLVEKFIDLTFLLIQISTGNKELIEQCHLYERELNQVHQKWNLTIKSAIILLLFVKQLLIFFFFNFKTKKSKKIQLADYLARKAFFKKKLFHEFSKWFFWLKENLFS